MIKIKKNNKQDNEYVVTMKVTAGKIQAIKNALEVYTTPVGQDLYRELHDACEDTNDRRLVDMPVVLRTQEP